MGKGSLTRQGGVQGTRGGGGHGGVTEQPAEYRGTESLAGPGRVRLGQPQVFMGLPLFPPSLRLFPYCIHTLTPVSASLHTLPSSSNRACPLLLQDSLQVGLKPLPPLDSAPPLGSLHSRSRPPASSRYCPFCFKCSALTSSPHLCRGSTPTSHSDPISSSYAPPTYRFLLGPSPSLPGPAPPPPIILRPHTSLQVPPLSEHQWGAGLMAAREGLVGGLSWGGSPTPVALETAGGGASYGGETVEGEKGAEASSAGNIGKPQAQGSSRVSPHSSAPACVPLVCFSSSSSVATGTPPRLGSPQN